MRFAKIQACIKSMGEDNTNIIKQRRHRTGGAVNQPSLAERTDGLKGSSSDLHLPGILRVLSQHARAQHKQLNED